jgi:hypothetical protein
MVHGPNWGLRLQGQHFSVERRPGTARLAEASGGGRREDSKSCRSAEADAERFSPCIS